MQGFWYIRTFNSKDKVVFEKLLDELKVINTVGEDRAENAHYVALEISLEEAVTLYGKTPPPGSHFLEFKAPLKARASV